MRKAIQLFILLSLLSTNAAAQEIWIKAGFISGNDYLALNDVNKRRYVIGVIDGIFLSPLFGAPKDKVGWVEKCVVAMTDVQFAAIINKYMRENPQRWHESMNMIIYSALREACSK